MVKRNTHQSFITQSPAEFSIHKIKYRIERFSKSYNVKGHADGSRKIQCNAYGCANINSK